MAGPSKQNRLAQSSSPYLLQHAKNPVDWFPWGEEALTKARAEDKPIVLSIGYAACHWCHVMERESFEDDATAAFMNEHFVSIKVDREERPDLDQVYQLVVQLMGRSGGWPLTVFLTPDQRPFFGGTYFPPTERYGMPSFRKVLEAMADAYANQRGEVAEQAKEMAAAIAEASRVSNAKELDLGQDLLARASKKLLARFDDRHGGFGGQPKFPNTMNLEVLLRRGVVEGDPVAKESVALALDRMRAGGIWDHLRGGFHRYSTDERWLVPHFEKMLYDNALLLRLYTDGFRVFGQDRYRETARELVAYLFAEMRDDAHGGAFFASQDADSEGHEGKFFVWTKAELHAVLGEPTSSDAAGPSLEAVALAYFAVTEKGNFEDSGATVLAESTPIDAVAASLQISVDDARDKLARAKELLLAAREKRPRPLRDDKVLASWNGLVISALADAGRAFGEPSWVLAAKAAFEALETRLLQGDRFGRYLKGGMRAAKEPGFLDDQAYLGSAALDLYEATSEPRFAKLAARVARAMVAHHWDADQGGFFFAPDDGEALLTRTKDMFDQAIPAAAAVAATLCLRLAALGAPELEEIGRRQLELAGGAALDNPLGMGQCVLALDLLARGSTDIVIVGGGAEAAALADVAFGAYLPRRTVVVVNPNDAESVSAAGSLAEGKPAGAEGVAVAYVCRDRSCSPPVAHAEELAALLREDAFARAQRRGSAGA